MRVGRGELTSSRADQLWLAVSVVGRQRHARQAIFPHGRFQRLLQAARREGIAPVEKRNGGAEYNDTNYIFLNFVISYLPAGLVGLIIAAVFAAAMSTISAELNSLATATVVDHYRRYINPNAADEHHTAVSKGATAFWGIYATVFASFGGQLGSLIEAVNIVGSIFYGTVLGLFLVGFFVRWVRATPVLIAALIAQASVIGLFLGTKLGFLWFNVVGAAIVVVLSVLLQALARPR